MHSNTISNIFIILFPFLFHVIAGNEPPVANAGKDQIIRLPNTCTTLSGKQSTDDVKVEVYVWEFVNGPSEGGIQDENEALTRACGMDVGGEYTYKLTVFDIEGLESSDTVTITVKDKPKARGPCLAEADVVFILDSSGSIGEDSFEKMLDFVRDVVERFDIDGGAVRIGLITYSDAAVSVFRLNEHKTTEDVVKGLKQVEYRYGLTHTSDALRLMRTQMFTEAAGDRPNVVNVAIIITDSESNVNHEMTVPEARLVKEDGITVLGVGIGLSERRHELEGIASAPQLVHFVHDYESLINNTASLTDPICVDDQDCASLPCENGGTCIEGLGGYTCRCKYGFGGKSCETKCPKEADIIFIVDSSASVGEQNFLLLKETVSTMVEQMDIESCGIQVGMVTYSTAARIQFHLNAHRTKVGILNAVDSVNYMDGYTHTADGIAAAHKQMFLTRFGDRPDARNVAVLLTDGYHNINLAKTLPSAREAEEDGIYVVTIGVAIPNKREMTEIASLRDEGSFYVDIFRDAPNTVKRVRKLIFEDEDQCKGNPCKNGGKCEDGIKQFKCTCPAGYSGKTCERSCESKSDVVFVVDASNRVGRDTFRLVKEFITQMVEEFEFTSGNTRVGVISYSNYARIILPLSEGTDKGKVMSAVSSLYYVGGDPFAADGLKLLTEDSFDKKLGDRADAQNIGVFITGGILNEEVTIAQAREAKSEGIHIIGIGINLGSADKSELNEIASDLEGQNIFHNTEDDTRQEVIERVTSQICGVMTECAKKPCENGGTCIIALNKYHCQCAPGFSGKKCERKCTTLADVVFLLDTSGSIEEEEFYRVKKFVQNVVWNLQLSPDQTRVGVITFSSQAHVKFHLDRYKDKLSLHRAIGALEYEYGDTYTGAALSMLRRKMFRRYNGDRPNIQNIGILMTDGESNINTFRTITEARKAKKHGIHIITVGMNISDIGRQELLAIASEPSEMNAYIAKEFRDLEKVEKKIIRAICQDTGFCTENPCLNGGSCVDKITTYVCECVEGFSGDKCEHGCPARRNLAFLLDQSFSMGESNFAKVKAFVKSIIEKLHVGGAHSEIALVTFSTEADIQFDFDQYYTKEGVLRGLDRTDYYGGSTNTGEGFQVLNEDVFYGKDRKNRPNIVILVVDGESNINPEVTLSESRKLRNSGVKIIGVGVNMSNRTEELKKIVNDPSSVFLVPSFDLLVNSTNKVYDSLCDIKNVSIKIEIPPKANAGKAQYITLPGPESVTLDASDSKDEQPGLRYHWEKQSGPPVEIKGENGPKAILSNLQDGIYMFKVKVTDSDGLEDEDKVRVEIKTENPPPIANAGDDVETTFGEDEVQLDGTKSSDDKGIVRFRWSQEAGPAMATIRQFNQPKPAISNFRTGKYKFRLTVYDGQRKQASDSVLLTVKGDGDQCLSNPCKNDGFCVDDINSYICKCKSKFTGINCEFPADTDQCKSNPCKNNGVCIDELGIYTCDCAPGFGGYNCEYPLREVDECASNPCENGQCIDGENSYLCDCYEGFTGRQCEKKIVAQDEGACESEPCQNNGLCYESRNGYTCQCTPEWTGHNCEDYIDIGGDYNVIVPGSGAGCGNVADIVFLLDASGSVTDPNFLTMLKFIDAVIDELKGQSRFGVATFSTNAKVEIYLGQYEDIDALQEAVFNIKYEPGQTNTAAGIQIVREQMFQAFNGARASAPDYLILLTDGVSNLNSGQTINQADRANFEGIEVIAVGIGLKQDYEVNAIAHDENHVFAVEQFDQLSYVVDPVTKLICAGR